VTALRSLVLAARFFRVRREIHSVSYRDDVTAWASEPDDRVAAIVEKYTEFATAEYSNA
jgi:hypothetical protein